MKASPSARNRWVRIAASLFLALLFAWQGTAQAQGVTDLARQEGNASIGLVSSPTPSPVAPAVGPSGEPSSTPEAAKPVATYLVPVAGPNLTGKVPPLDGSRAIAAQAGAVTIAAGYVPGQWYDHYAYYTLDGTEVEQYTNFQETSAGQYINLQVWSNHNGGPDRYLKDMWIGSQYRSINSWLSSGPSYSPQHEYTEGIGTHLTSAFQAQSFACPCWQADLVIGSH